jgi:steroid delta-isomerase-like uncharacterized protein
MSITDNKQLVRRWFEEAWNKGRVEAIDEMCAPEGVVHGLDGKDVAGLEALRAVHVKFQGAFSNSHVDINHIVAEADMVAVHWTRTATHSGEALGFSATGRTIAFGGTLFVRIEAGKLAESWNYVDQARMLQQLGRPDLVRAL